MIAPRQREREGHEEVEEAGRERLVRADVEAPEEADEERLAHREPLSVNGTSMTRKSSGPIT